MVGSNNSSGLMLLGGYNTAARPLSLLGSLGSSPKVKRKSYFSFHFSDVLRANVVRQAWKITHPDSALMRSFYDSSLWESKKLVSADALKKLIRDGVSYTSAVCVLAGSETWCRRWVRYEIARAIIDGRGLLVVHLNSIRHHSTKLPNLLGPNPLSNMAVGKVQGTFLGQPQYYLFEHTVSGWRRYADYTFPVSRPAWLPDPAVGYLMPLSSGSNQYDYITQEGHKNIGTWIDKAALVAGR